MLTVNDKATCTPYLAGPLIRPVSRAHRLNGIQRLSLSAFWVLTPATLGDVKRKAEPIYTVLL